MAAIHGKWYASHGANAGDAYPQSDNTVRFVYATQPDGERYIVAKVWSGDDGDYEGTARLVAAAPELLDALRQAKDQLIELYEQVYADDEGDNDTADVIDAIISAIDKAEGRSDARCSGDNTEVSDEHGGLVG